MTREEIKAAVDKIQEKDLNAFMDGVEKHITQQQLKWIKEHPAHPSVEGWYRVMHPGDSDSIDGHTLYEYGDYPGWAYWQPERPAESIVAFEGKVTVTALGVDEAHWICEHDEDGEGIFAYYGPITIPEFKE